MPILQMALVRNPAQLQDIAEDLIEPRLTRIPEVALSLLRWLHGGSSRVRSC